MFVDVRIRAEPEEILHPSDMVRVPMGDQNMGDSGIFG